MSKTTDEAAIRQAYEAAKDIYAHWGVNPDKAIETLKKLSLSLPCWQGDDVVGFEKKPTALGGGILVTGGSPGRARNGQELRADLDFSMGLLPGKHRVNLHAMYGESNDIFDRDAVEPKHFDSWVAWAKDKKIGLDFNPTYFSHPKASAGLTLSHPDSDIRQFWICHGQACRKIAADIGKSLGTVCTNNTWIPDGYKDAPVDRWEARHRLEDSLNQILKTPVDSKFLVEAVESKLFGIGLESATIGSHEFYLGYAVKNGLAVCLDMGHFHPTEDISDKLSAVLMFCPSVLLHLSRPVRWDSDHVAIQDDAVLKVAEELNRINAWDRVYMSLDYFDATLNRPAAWIIGVRAVLRSLLIALLQPTEMLQEKERSGDATGKLMLLEELKGLPWQAVWDWYCLNSGVPVRSAWYDEVLNYSKNVLSKRI